MFGSAVDSTVVVDANSGNNGPQIATLKAGSYQARIAWIAYLPKQEKTFKGDTKVRDLLRIGFQSRRPLVDVDGKKVEDGRCYSWTNEYTLSLADKATLKNHFAHIFTEDSYSLIDMINLLMNAQVTVGTVVAERAKDGKTRTFSEIQSVSAPSDEIEVNLEGVKVEIPQWIAKKWSENYVVRHSDRNEKGELQGKLLKEFVKEEADTSRGKAEKPAADVPEIPELD